MADTLPVYLYTGPEFGQRDDAVEALRAKHKKQFGVIDEHLFYLLDTPFSQVMTILESGTLFSDGVFVVCKSVELLKKKEDIQMLSNWISNPVPSAVLVLISDDITVDAKLEKLIPPSNRQKFWEMYEDKKVQWITDYFRKNGYRITGTAISMILEMVENNTQALKNECSRFFVCFPKEHEITSDDVDSILVHNREENAFTLFNEIADPTESVQNRLEKGLEILQKIRLSKENSSVMIIAGLTSCFRKLVLWHNEGESAITGKTMQKQYRNAAKIWSVGQATAILANLATIDMEIRSGGSLMEDVFLQKMIYEIVVKKGASTATVDML